MKTSITAISAITLLTALDIGTARAEQLPEAVSQLSAIEADGDLKALEENMDMGDVIALFREQQKEMAAQRKLLESQAQKIDALTQQLQAVQAPLPAASEELTAQRKLLENQSQKLDSQSQKIATLTRELDDLHSPSSPPVQQSTVVTGAGEVSPPVAIAEDAVTSQPKTVREKAKETGDAVAQAQTDDPVRDMLKDFKGAWRLPGTNAALAIGGFVKTAIVYNFDALQIKDRFITGSIPVGISETTGDEAQSSITADQSRLNFDLRSPTDFGPMRAFIEGDFAGSENNDDNDDNFRLRHAFGQWRHMLAGKT